MVREEALATMNLLEDPEVIIVSSRFTLCMIDEIKDDVKYEHVYSLISEYSDETIKEHKLMLDQALDLQKNCKLSKLEDALHIVLACHGNADYFGTADQEIINKGDCIKLQLQKLEFVINIANPIDLVKGHGSDIQR